MHGPHGHEAAAPEQGDAGRVAGFDAPQQDSQAGAAAGLDQGLGELQTQAAPLKERVGENRDFRGPAIGAARRPLRQTAPGSDRAIDIHNAGGVAWVQVAGQPVLPLRARPWLGIKGRGAVQYFGVVDARNAGQVLFLRRAHAHVSMGRSVGAPSGARASPVPWLYTCTSRCGKGISKPRSLHMSQMPNRTCERT